ncbi:MAG: hypothetical protein K2K06_01340, partial [Oscillospiraceae bacterium]|nr:hypothetical protein [Oscillospiraceae bacterium]
TNVNPEDKENSDLDIESLEMFENVAYIMAQHADPAHVANNPDDWLEQFNVFSIYEILPELLKLWGMNTEQQVKSKKNLVRLIEK